MSKFNLHPDIAAAENKSPHGNGKIIRVVSPSAGVWGGEPINGLVTLIYECNCHAMGATKTHTHAALYGPRILQWADDCLTCGLHKWSNHGGHEYVATGEEKVDPDHYELYAD